MHSKEKKITGKQIAVLAVIVIVYLLFALNIYHKFISNGSTKNMNKEKLSITSQLQQGDEIVQKFQPQKNMSAITLYFATYANGKNGQGNLKIRLMDYDTGEVLAETDLNTQLLYDQMQYKFAFDVDNLSDRETAVAITAEELSEEATVSLYLGEMNERIDSECIYNGTVLENALRMDYSFVEFGYTEKIVILCLVVMLAVIITVYIMLVVKKAAIHNVYLAAVLLLGLIYILLLPEFASPDEGTHIQKAIQLSNSVLGYDDLHENFVRRQCEAELFDVNLSKMDRDSYEYYYSNLLHGNNSEKLTEKDYDPLATPKYQYFLSAFGITIGRLLNLNGLQTFMIGMLLNFAFYVVVTYFAIRIIPLGKITVAIVCLLPISLQQATSYSYDCMLIAVSVMFFSAFLRVIYEKGCERRYYIILAVATVMFIPTKQFAYVSILLLIGYLVFSRIKNKLTRKAWIIIAGTASAIVVVSVAIVFTWMGTSQTGQSAVQVPFVAWMNQPGYTLQSLLAAPLDTIDMFWKTLYEQSDFYVTSAFGGKLGWLNINLPMYAVCLYLITAIVSIMPSENNQSIKLKGSIRILFLTVFFASIGCAMGGMILSWTPISSDYILGVQGRYFLPVILMGIFALRGNGIKITESMERCCLMLAVVCQPLTIAGVLYSM